MPTIRKGNAVRGVLATATCTLLGTTAAPVDAQEDGTWDFNTAVLFYGESDSRVQDASVSVLARRSYVDDRFLTLGLTVDSLTGATPNGALRQSGPQTFTRPSGNAAYTEADNTLPLDDTFKDTRAAFTASWQQPWGERNTINVGLSGSREYDYTHLGLNARIARNFNKNNTTLSTGLAFARDRFDPVGGTPTPLTSMLDVGDLSNRTGYESKNIVDVVLGVTQVVNRNFVAQLNYSFSDASGYQTDPYKVLSVTDAVTGNTLPRPPTPAIEGPSHQFLFESRPDERTKHSLYAQGKWYMGGKVLDASYRYMTDDWDIDSHTIDIRYRLPRGKQQYLEPHARFYTQTAAEFYQLALIDGAPLPAFASADYRLAEFDATTVGLKYGWKAANDNDMSVRLEFYRQFGAGDADFDAVIAQFSYRFGR